MNNNAPSRWTELWKKEDYWAIWLGFSILLIGVILYVPKSKWPADLEKKIDKANVTLEAEAKRAPFKTIGWYKASDSKKKLKSTGTPAGKWMKWFTSKPQSKWKGNPLYAFYMGEEKANALKEKAAAKYEKAKAKNVEAMTAAKASENAAAAAEFKNEGLNKAAIAAIATWRDTRMKASKAKKSLKGKKPYNHVKSLILLGIALGLFFSIGMIVMKTENPARFFLGFLLVFLIAVLSYVAANNIVMKKYGIGYAAWAILFGMLISNTVGTPKWAMPGVKTEYFIKTGLVLLGAEILFGKILAIGTPGIFVAWIVTPIVLTSTYWFGQRVVKIPSKTLNITVSADMSVCGVSAAIATAAACKAKKEELTLAIGLSLIFTSIMMIAMPAFIKAVGIPEILGGAWMGGTIDSTGAVAAAGAFLGEKALYVAATIKMIQNVLIGVVAFFVALIWTTRIDRNPDEKVSPMEIWYRFPKFVIGFIAASIIFSAIYGALGKDISHTVIDHGAIRGMSKLLRGWMFCLAFSSIGLATNFRELKEYFKGGKPLILYVVGQSLNLCLTLLMAYIMFYKVFPEITATI